MLNILNINYLLFNSFRYLRQNKKILIFYVSY